MINRINLHQPLAMYTGFGSFFAEPSLDLRISLQPSIARALIKPSHSRPPSRQLYYVVLRWVHFGVAVALVKIPFGSTQSPVAAYLKCCPAHKFIRIFSAPIYRTINAARSCTLHMLEHTHEQCPETEEFQFFARFDCRRGQCHSKQPAALPEEDEKHSKIAYKIRGCFVRSSKLARRNAVRKVVIGSDAQSSMRSARL